MSERRMARLPLLAAVFLCTAIAPSAFAQPVNDDCVDAIEIVCPTGGGSVTVSGFTTGATGGDAGFCGTSNTAPGVWYKVTHDGLITASTCNQANYDTKISVYDGGCGTLGCVTGLDDTSGCGGFTTELTWGSDGTDEQLILVHGFGSATGDFDLTITCAEAVANDECEDAIGPLAVGSVTSGTTDGATSDEPPSLDCGTTVTAPGVWYTVTGTGNTMTASTCNDGNPATGSADYDTKISVYCADCENPECIGGVDDTSGCSGFSTQFSWPTQAGATYNVFVHGFSSQQGDFDLAILDDGTPATGANDCDGVAEQFDLCQGTTIPESVPTSGELKLNRWALTDGDNVFDTFPAMYVDPFGPADPPNVYDLGDTAGCSCEQIIDEVGLGNAHSKWGCHTNAMDDWLTFLDEASCGDCLVPHGTTGCEVAACEAVVCAADPFCCNVLWDGLCVIGAQNLCVPDLCIALPPSPGAADFEFEGARPLPSDEPIIKLPVPVVPSK